MGAKQGWPFSWNPGGLMVEKREQLDVLPSLLPSTAHPGVSGFPVSWSSGNSGIFNYQPGTPAGCWGQWCPVTPARRWSPREQAQKRLVAERGRGRPARQGLFGWSRWSGALLPPASPGGVSSPFIS